VDEALVGAPQAPRKIAIMRRTSVIFVRTKFSRILMGELYTLKERKKFRTACTILKEIEAQR
jgi:hypothetical protein